MLVTTTGAGEESPGKSPEENCSRVCSNPYTTANMRSPWPRDPTPASERESNQHTVDGRTETGDSPVA